MVLFPAMIVQESHQLLLPSKGITKQTISKFQTYACMPLKEKMRVKLTAGMYAYVYSLAFMADLGNLLDIYRGIGICKSNISVCLRIEY